MRFSEAAGLRPHRAVVVLRSLALAASLMSSPRVLAQQTATGGASAAAASVSTPQRPIPAWVERSNQNAQLLLDVLASFSPETASRFGAAGMDDKVVDLKPNLVERVDKSEARVLASYRQRLAAEKDPLVRQDLDILIQATERFQKENRVYAQHQLPYFDMAGTVFQGLRSLLDEQVVPERRAAAVIRLRRYAGLEAGTTPITTLAMARTRERFATPGLLPPIQAEVQRDLDTSSQYIAGIEQLFQQYPQAGWEEPWAKLKQQLTEYEAFVRQDILPRARTDFRQPPEMYALALEESGIDMPVEDLVARAEAGFAEIRNEMVALAPLVAKEKGFTVTDYRDVMRELKKDQLVGEAILPHYQARIKDLEKIIRDQHIVTLPARPMAIRLASEAESAATPAPNMRPPRLIGNTGEIGEFVLPLRIPGAGGQKQQFDDFTYAAASWTLTAHEGRPGHELQFASIVEGGVSLARALFAFNSVNVEGWGLYAEAESKPYMPLDGQLVCLQNRLLRAARAFLDPGLQLGTVTQEEAFRLLHEEVVLSEAMANQEVQRYTFRAPGQAPSYFCGYTRLMELRTATERALGPSFDRQKYHDFLLAQGMLPPKLLRKAVLEEFVPQQKAVAAGKGATAAGQGATGVDGAAARR